MKFPVLWLYLERATSLLVIDDYYVPPSISKVYIYIYIYILFVNLSEKKKSMSVFVFVEFCHRKRKRFFPANVPMFQMVKIEA